MKYLKGATFFTIAISFGAAAADVPPYLADRGPGVPTSMFGTYVEPGQLLVYPYFEYYLDHNLEYEPYEFDYGLEKEFRGKYRASEGLIFLGYGFTDWLAQEFELAWISAELTKADDDPSDMPAKLAESGLGDIETQTRIRWLKETATRPEVFNYAEVVFPNHGEKGLIGTMDWEFKLGTGVTRGLGWGTWTVRLAVEYDKAEEAVALGEYAVEYLKRLSPAWRVYAGVEGSDDEIELIAEAQWHLSRFAFVKLNNAVGLTSKATDWAPEVGVMFVIPTR
ncbi:MAG: hypothetical protein GTN49_05065 [candidate division Zixibacteria bacterium]|nr:hypothetical protein [candidate division Zixibacteria bacterium]